MQVLGRIGAAQSGRVGPKAGGLIYNSNCCLYTFSAVSGSHHPSSNLVARREKTKLGAAIQINNGSSEALVEMLWDWGCLKWLAGAIRELSSLILTRGPKLCNFVEWKGYKAVYRRYASLYFCMCVDQDDNELEILEIIHHFVEILDRYFGSVCELDLIFNFHKAYYILDEILIAGELQESSKKIVARLIAAQVRSAMLLDWGKWAINSK
ncbi:hypothetical protein ZIOFF_001756 [Zingiber officinale]|uniref:Adaptor AP-1 19 kDa protein n=1 Tax=Zingiber officinale TaxID=94328 RepID=A0A8J5HVA1_ZINOF|nr:hypothetical protein ZIOFF_001756 [Zingiber officinale]